MGSAKEYYKSILSQNQSSGKEIFESEPEPSSSKDRHLSDSSLGSGKEEIVIKSKSKSSTNDLIIEHHAKSKTSHGSRDLSSLESSNKEHIMSTKPIGVSDSL